MGDYNVVKGIAVDMRNVTSVKNTYTHRSTNAISTNGVQ